MLIFWGFLTPLMDVQDGPWLSLRSVMAPLVALVEFSENLVYGVFWISSVTDKLYKSIYFMHKDIKSIWKYGKRCLEDNLESIFDFQKLLFPIVQYIRSLKINQIVEGKNLESTGIITTTYIDATSTKSLNKSNL